MCGIAIYFGKNSLNKNQIFDTLNLMKRRGPDSQNYKVINFKKKNINLYLLHSRLNIIDLNERSNQPFQIQDYSLIFNGEIYNYLEIRSLLKKRGVKFKTRSDTEVLLQAYINFGEKCLELFEGMWSFVIWDNKKKKIFVSRDRFGEKPLFYHQTQDGIYIASEIKFIKSLSNKIFKVNKGHLCRYLFQGYKSLHKYNSNFFSDINSFPPSSYTYIDFNLDLKFKKYWKLKYIPDYNLSLEDSIHQSKQLLINSMKQKLRADVPVAFCLSGGIDSSSIASISRKLLNKEINTYSIIDTQKNYNEIKNIKYTVKDLNSNHTNYYYKKDNNLKNLEQIISYNDGPLATANYYIHSLLCKEMSNDGFKVSYSGIGADEIYTGYYDHTLQYLSEIYDSEIYEKSVASWKKNISKLIRNPKFKNPSLYIKNKNQRDHIFDNFQEFKKWLVEGNARYLKKFKEINYSKSLLRNRMLNEIYHEGVITCLHEDDRNSMFHSIENRSPFLDSKLAAFMYTVPNKLLMKNGYAKFILRESMRNIISDKIRNDYEKRGFNFSIESIVDTSSKEFRNRFMDKDNKIFKYVNYNHIKKLLSKKNFTNNYSKFIFNFVNTQLFLEQNKD